MDEVAVAAYHDVGIPSFGDVPYSGINHRCSGGCTDGLVGTAGIEIHHLIEEVRSREHFASMRSLGRNHHYGCADGRDRRDEDDDPLGTLHY